MKTKVIGRRITSYNVCYTKLLRFGEQIIGLMDAAIASRTSVGVIGLATALYVGLLWMQRLRAALSQMWGQQFPPPGFLNTKISDVVALVAAFMASLLTIGFGVLVV